MQGKTAAHGAQRGLRLRRRRRPLRSARSTRPCSAPSRTTSRGCSPAPAGPSGAGSPRGRSCKGLIANFDDLHRRPRRRVRQPLGDDPAARRRRSDDRAALAGQPQPRAAAAARLRDRAPARRSPSCRRRSRPGSRGSTQARPLLSQARGRRDRRAARRRAPRLGARRPHETLGLLPQLTGFSRCVDENLVPAGNVRAQIERGSRLQHRPAELPRVLLPATDFAGESAELRRQRHLRPLPARRRPGPGQARTTRPAAIDAEKLYGNTIAPPLGTRPAATGSLPPFKRRRPLLQERASRT